MTLIKNLFPLLPFIAFSLLLVGCVPIGLPAMFVNVPALTYVGYGNSAFNVVSFAGSGKSVSDHMLSNMTGKDCNMMNLFNAEGMVCSEVFIGTVDPVGRNRFYHLYIKDDNHVQNKGKIKVVFFPSP